MANYFTFTSQLTKSKYNPLFALNSALLNQFNSDFLHPIFIAFCEENNLDPGSLKYLNIELLITEKEFNNTSEELIKPYFYNTLFSQISKKEDGTINYLKYYTFTFDKSLTPINKNDINFGSIFLGNKPIFYYIFVDLQKAIDFLKEY